MILYASVCCGRRSIEQLVLVWRWHWRGWKCAQQIILLSERLVCWWLIHTGQLKHWRQIARQIASYKRMCVARVHGPCHNTLKTAWHSAATSGLHVGLQCKGATQLSHYLSATYIMIAAIETTPRTSMCSYQDCAAIHRCLARHGADNERHISAMEV